MSSIGTITRLLPGLQEDENGICMGARKKRRVDTEQPAPIVRIGLQALAECRPTALPVPRIKVTTANYITFYKGTFIRNILFEKLTEKTREILSDTRVGTEVQGRFPRIIKFQRKIALRVGDLCIPAHYVTDTESGRVFVACKRSPTPVLSTQLISDGNYDIIGFDSTQSKPNFYEKKSFLTRMIVAKTEDTYYGHMVEEKKHHTCRDFYVRLNELDVKKLKYIVENLELCQGKILLLDQTDLDFESTIITAYFLKQRITAGKVLPKNIGSSLIDLISILRKQCGPGFIQTREQFNTLMDLACDLY